MRPARTPSASSWRASSSRASGSPETTTDAGPLTAATSTVRRSPRRALDPLGGQRRRDIMPPRPSMRAGRGCAAATTGRRRRGESAPATWRRRSRPGSGRPPRPARPRRTRHSAASETMTANSAGWTTSTRSSAGAPGAPRRTSAERPVHVRRERRGARLRSARRRPASASSSSSAMPGHCEPWPGKTNTGAPPAGAVRHTLDQARRGPALRQARESVQAAPRRSPPRTTRPVVQAARVVASDQPTSSRAQPSCSERCGDQPRGPLASAGAVLAGRTGHRDQPAGRAPASGVRRRPGPAPPRDEWQLVPPMPKELTPGDRRRGVAARARGAVCTRRPSSSERDRGVRAARS